MNMARRLITKLSSHVGSKYKPLPHFQTRTHFTGTAQANEPSLGLQVTLTSREVIKPSSPTPRHLKTVLLSVVDQMQPSYHMPVILFYQNNSYPRNDPLARSVALKKSLSETLVRFYPLAGRLQGNECISCEDEGVEFCDATVSHKLDNILENPNLEELQALLPFKMVPASDKNVLLSVQLSHFSCGGYAISLRISHKIADGASVAAFINAWASTARGEGSRVLVPKFNGASIFPPLQELSHVHPGDDRDMYTQKIASRRLIFDNRKISQLKARVSGSPVPTQVEVVTAFIWKQLMLSDAASKIDSVMHAVSCRTRMIPPIPEASFGNFGSPTRTSPLINGPQTGFPELVYSLRTALNKINHDYMTNLLQGDDQKRWTEINKEKDNYVNGDDCCFFTSLCRYPFYEANFGMGEPVWACITTFPVTNMVVLSSTKCGQGIEAWIHMRQDVINDINFDENHPLSRLGYPMPDPLDHDTFLR